MAARCRLWHHAGDALTSLRVVVTPLFAVLAWRAPGAAGARWGALLLFFIIAASDLLDGHLARRAGATSIRGRVLDHGADILFVLTALATYVARGVTPWWVPAAVAAAFGVYAGDFWLSQTRNWPAPAGRSRIGHRGGVLNYALIGVLVCNDSVAAGLLPGEVLGVLHALVPIYSGAAIVEHLYRRDPARARRWWRERELLWLVAVIAAIYCTRITSPSLRGEESRRARVAAEMMATGDWIVPRQQGQPYHDRPPLQKWAIAGSARLTGGLSPLAIRLPSVLAVIGTGALLYGCARALMGPLAGLAAGLAFATMGQVLELGRLGETEALFSFMVSAALLLWHLGYVRGWPPAVTWMVGYGLAALGALTKGVQAPLYFIGSTGLFLLLEGRWRFLFSRSHAAGLVVFVALLAPWQLMHARAVGWDGVRAIWFNEVGIRFTEAGVARIAGHGISFPLEVLVSTLPWSALLACYVVPRARAELSASLPQARFLLLALTLAFVTCWLPPGARPRYLMPLYPIAALLAAVVVERAGAQATWAASAWQRFARIMTGGMALCGAAVLGVSLVTTPALFRWAQPWPLALTYAAFCAAAAAVMRKTTRGGAPPRLAALVTVALFLGLSYTGVVVNALANTSVDTEASVARLKQQLPRGHRLLSLGPIHHLFAYYYRDPIALLEWSDPGVAAELAKPETFFCFYRSDDRRIEPSFAWQPVAVISVARSRDRAAEMQVIVGRLSGDGAAPPR
ncbi:MAG: glycosyltransferase family 39 protein [Deltaproteobacteria bacterium]|nr:glycosyltransferase family 39 protein [Deltaproteobacteria bacterium]